MQDELTVPTPTWKDLVSTRFGVVLFVVWRVSVIAVANPEIAWGCVVVMGIIALAHIASRTFTKRKKQAGAND